MTEHLNVPVRHGNGFHIPQGFWRITFGNIIAGVVAVASVIYSFGQVNTKIEEVVKWKENFEKRIDERMDHFDESGTAAGKRRNEVEDSEIKDHEQRIFRNESSIAQIVPDVREIKTKVDILTNLLTKEEKTKR